ncbi:MAG: DUF4340 domain-containing protein [Bacteroidales bacterium]|nr:DUF4340 domain-containing protein [Bacteroidales bacterium]
MNKKYWLYIVFLALIIISAIIFFTNQYGTIKKELKDFAYDDTSSVNKIFLANKNNETILLERINVNKWLVNKKFIARQDAINILLDAIASIQVKSPVPKNSFEQITKLLATRSTKVEIYANDKLVKTYFVGDPTPDHLGTYMILENSSVPFIVHKPGFMGYLSIRYFTDETEWRDVSIFPVPISQVYSIQVVYPADIKNSYQIIRKSVGIYELTNINNEPITPFDTILVKETAISIVKSKVSRWLKYNVKQKIDSLKNFTPIANITLKTINGNKYTLSLYQKTFIDRDSSNNIITEPDTDTMYGIINNNELTLCQYFTFDPILLKINSFYIK